MAAGRRPYGTPNAPQVPLNPRFGKPEFMFGREPAYAILTSAVCCGILAWIIGPLLTPWLLLGADRTSSHLLHWTTTRMTASMQAPPTADAIFSGFIGWVLQIPLIIILMAAYVVLALVGIAFQVAGLLHLFPFIGAFLGMIPGHHTAPFVAMGRTIPNFVGYGYEFAHARTLSDRLWSAAPFVLVAGVLSSTWFFVIPRVTQQPWWPAQKAATQQAVIRYTSADAGLKSAVAMNRHWRFEVDQVMVTPSEIEVQVRITNRGSKRKDVVIGNRTRLTTGIRLSVSREDLSAIDLDARRLSIPGDGDYADATLRFPRTTMPFRT